MNYKEYKELVEKMTHEELIEEWKKMTRVLTLFELKVI